MLSWKTGKAPGFRIGTAFCLGMSMLSITLSLTGCSPEESPDKTSPDPIIKLPKSQGKYLFGVTDTIVVDFSERIDTAALAPTFEPPQSIGYRFSGQNRLLIFGTNASTGVPHFNINSPFTVTLAGLKDLAGNGQAAVVESFQPYAWTDRDFLDTTFTGYDSLFSADSTKWADGSDISDSLITEGSLDFSNNLGTEDRQDFKIMRLYAPDTLHFGATCSKSLNLRVQIAGPFAPASLDSVLKDFKFNTGSFYSDSTKTKGSLAYGFIADFFKHNDRLGSPAAPGIYVIRLSIPEDTEGFYRLGLRLRKYKRVI